MDEFDDEYDQENDDEKGQQGSKDSDPIRQLRAQNRQLSKQLKELTPLVEEYKSLQAKTAASERTESAAKVLTDMGLNPAHAKYFFTDNGAEAQATPEAVAKWALENNFGVPEERVAEVETIAEGPRFVPLSPGNAVPVSQKLSREQYSQLRLTDWEAARKAVAEGRVEGFTARLVESADGRTEAEAIRPAGY